MPDEEAIKLRPRRPKVARDDSKAWSSAFKGLMRIARMTSTRQQLSPASIRPRIPHKQRCAVRVTYSPNHIGGQWAAHGRYIARESASADGVGFNMVSDEVAIPATLARWQSSGDRRLFKMIVSPEFGERVNLKKHTRDLISRLSQDLNAELEWVAVAHFNTGHPHVHIALRGVTAAGDLRLPRDVIKHTIRRNAEDLCTEQLGFRTIDDSFESERREISSLNVTSLDRRLKRMGTLTTGGLISITLPDATGTDRQVPPIQHLAARLHVLSSLGLAEPKSRSHWNLRADFLDALRTIERSEHRRQPRLNREGALQEHSPQARGGTRSKPRRANTASAPSRSGSA